MSKVLLEAFKEQYKLLKYVHIVDGKVESTKYIKRAWQEKNMFWDIITMVYLEVTDNKTDGIDCLLANEQIGDIDNEIIHIMIYRPESKESAFRRIDQGGIIIDKNELTIIDKD